MGAEEPALDGELEGRGHLVFAEALEEVEEDLDLGGPGPRVLVDDLGEERLGVAAQGEELLALHVEAAAPSGDRREQRGALAGQIARARGGPAAFVEGLVLPRLDAHRRLGDEERRGEADRLRRHRVAVALVLDHRGRADHRGEAECVVARQGRDGAKALALDGHARERRLLRRTGGPHLVDLAHPRLELLEEVLLVDEAPHLEEAPLHEADEVLDGALLLAARGRAELGRETVVERRLAEGPVPLDLVADAADDDGLGVIEDAGERDASEAHEAGDQRAHQGLHLLVRDDRDVDPARVLQPRREEVDLLRRARGVAHDHLAEVVLAEFARQSLEAHERRLHRRAHLGDEVVERALPAVVAAVPHAEEDLHRRELRLRLQDLGDHLPVRLDLARTARPSPRRRVLTELVTDRLRCDPPDRALRDPRRRGDPIRRRPRLLQDPHLVPLHGVPHAPLLPARRPCGGSGLERDGGASLRRPRDLPGVPEFPERSVPEFPEPTTFATIGSRDRSSLVRGAECDIRRSALDRHASRTGRGSARDWPWRAVPDATRGV